jgi:hypothetical protein
MHVNIIYIDTAEKEAKAEMEFNELFENHGLSSLNDVTATNATTAHLRMLYAEMIKDRDMPTNESTVEGGTKAAVKKDSVLIEGKTVEEFLNGLDGEVATDLVSVSACIYPWGEGITCLLRRERKCCQCKE